MPSLRAQQDEVYDSEALTKVHTTGEQERYTQGLKVRFDNAAWRRVYAVGLQMERTVRIGLRALHGRLCGRCDIRRQVYWMVWQVTDMKEWIMWRMGRVAIKC
jgi:hypothetical protein